MAKFTSKLYFLVQYTATLFLFWCIPCFRSLSTVAVSETSGHTLICAIHHTTHSLNCTNVNSSGPGIHIPGNFGASFTALVAGDGFVCGLISYSASSRSSLICWRFSVPSNDSTSSTVPMPKRIYNGPRVTEVVAGNTRICGLVANDAGNRLQCWPWRGFRNSNASKANLSLSSIAVGNDFVCGLSDCSSGDSGRAECYEMKNTTVEDLRYNAIAAGSSHACGILFSNSTLHCWGNVAVAPPKDMFVAVALGEDRGCALQTTGKVICWGIKNFSLPQNLRDEYFVSIEAKRKVFCGVKSEDYSLYCWGNEYLDSNPKVFENVLPGACSTTKCECGPMAGSGPLCGQSGHICNPCGGQCPGVGNNPPPPTPQPPPMLQPPPMPQPPPSGEKISNKMVAFLVVGCVGSFSLLLVVGFLLFQYCKGRVCRVHDSGRLEDTPSAHSPSPGSPQASHPPVLEKRLSHLVSLGTGNGAQLEEFSLEALVQATHCFSEDSKIGTGSFGSVYHGTLEDGREVAIKRAEVSTTSSSNEIVVVGTKKQEEKDNAFVNELESLSRLNHKNLVRLLGFCEDRNELILVYEYMKNGTLHDHLHKLQPENSPLMSWPARLKAALDAARGIEYLHVYAVPPVIHRDIKSSNILLDSNWTAKVSDFGLSLMAPEDEDSHLSLHAAGTFGYVDPEYYRLQHLTPKSDVYSFGVVLLELLSGYPAIHKNENGVPRNVVDVVVPYIIQDEIHRALDRKVAPPTPFEIEAVAYVGYLAADCVSLEGRDRPSMSEIVNSLERALEACSARPTYSRSSTESST